MDFSNTNRDFGMGGGIEAAAKDLTESLKKLAVKMTDEAPEECYTLILFNLDEGLATGIPHRRCQMLVAEDLDNELAAKLVSAHFGHAFHVTANMVKTRRLPLNKMVRM